MYKKEESVGKTLPVFLMVTLVPLIVKLKTVDFSSLDLWYINSTDLDIFSFYKMIAIIGLAGVGLLAFLIDYSVGEKISIKKTNYYKPMLVYLIFVWISYIFSDYKNLSMLGAPGRYEGALTLSAYILIAIVAINTVTTEKQIKFVLYGLIASAIIMAIIGTFQYFGKDLFNTDFAQKIYLGTAYARLKDSISINFGDSWIYATLYNPNYVGSYMAMVVPMTIMMAYLNKNKIIKGIFILLALLFAFNIFGSNSRAGFVGLFASFIFGIILIIVKNKGTISKTTKFPVKSGLAILFLLLIVINIATDGVILRPINRITKEFKKVNKEEYLKDIVEDGNDLIFITKDTKLKISHDSGNLTFYDEDDNNIQFDNNEGVLNFTDKRYKNYTLKINAIEGEEGSYRGDLYDSNNGNTYYIGITSNAIYLSYTGLQNVELENPSTFGFKGYEGLASSRGYIWSRSIPILFKNFIKGIGPDTFITEFPQGDLVGKANYYSSPYMVVDKPHNFYLQNGINTGIVSLVALMIIFIIYIIQSIKLYINTEKNSNIAMVLGFLIAIIGYLVAGMFNDSTVSVSPVFWVLLGVGISINYTIKKDTIKKEVEN